MRHLTIIIIFSAFFSCGTPTELKSVNWNKNTITWSVLDGGATTSYYWKIHFNKSLIFESYSSPYITDISIDGNNLIIHCLGVRNSNEFIKIDLNKIEDFIDDPVEYERTTLEQTNSSYREPNFVKKERESVLIN